MFIINVTPEPGDILIYDYLQATEASVMQGLFAKYLANLIAENAARSQASLPLFNIFDIDISGGGDGYTFVVRIGKTTATVTNPTPAGWAAANLDDAGAVFWMGSDAEALAEYSEGAIAQLRGTDQLAFMFVGTAGAAKGTRFMAFVAGILTGGG